MYIVRLSSGAIKIGRTIHLQERLYHHFHENGDDLELLYIIKTEMSYELERRMLAYSDHWFKAHHGFEYYILNPDELEVLVSIAKEFEKTEVERYQKWQYERDVTRFSSLMKFCYNNRPKKLRTRRKPPALNVHTFIAKMDSQGRIRVPKQVRDAKGFAPSELYEVNIKEIVEKESK